jgi:hypothetical protein
VSVVIRRSGYAYTWICKVPVKQPSGKTKVCNHTEVVNSEQEATRAYDAHKKRAAGH